MLIRKAEKKDIDYIRSLLFQVQQVHADGRGDLFRSGSRKYTDEEVFSIMENPDTPIFVADDNGTVLGYAFCILQRHTEASWFPITTLYIDDLCVDEASRGRHVGTELYNYVLAYAKQIGCYNVTLNVWACNPAAQRFYESCGLKVQKTGMETIL